MLGAALDGFTARHKRFAEYAGERIYLFFSTVLKAGSYTVFFFYYFHSKFFRSKFFLNFAKGTFFVLFMEFA